MEDEILYYGPSRYTVLDNLISGRTYSFRVKATNLVGDGDWSNEYIF
jgi:hypothetical protein